MPSATISIPPLTEHVRAVRMVAGAAARRGRVPEDLIDEVRLAVGEAVARVVLRHQAAGISDDVVVTLRDDLDSFEVEVDDHTAPSQPDDDDGLSVALTASLVPQSSVVPTPQGHHRVRLVWPLDS